MEALLDTKNGVASLLASICALLAFHLLFKVGEFLWEILKKKNEVSEQTFEKLTAALQVNTRAVHELKTQIHGIERDLSEIPKLKLDLKRLFSAVKTISGDKWPSIRREIMEEVAEPS